MDYEKAWNELKDAIKADIHWIEYNPDDNDETRYQRDKSILELMDGIVEELSKK